MWVFHSTGANPHSHVSILKSSFLSLLLVLGNWCSGFFVTKQEVTAVSWPKNEKKKITTYSNTKEAEEEKALRAVNKSWCTRDCLPCSCGSSSIRIEWHLGTEKRKKLSWVGKMFSLYSRVTLVRVCLNNPAQYSSAQGNGAFKCCLSRWQEASKQKIMQIALTFKCNKRKVHQITFELRYCFLFGFLFEHFLLLGVSMREKHEIKPPWFEKHFWSVRSEHMVK